MGMRIRGWFSEVIEVSWSGESDSFGEFIGLINEIGPWATLLSSTQSGSPLDALIEGQMEHSHYIRVEAPMSMAAHLLSRIEEAARQAFPGP